MNIVQIQYAMEIARQNSISKAAERLFVSQPALSAQLRLLEKELGCRLFMRSAHGVKLTEAGRLFCADAEEILRAWSKLQDDFSARTEDFGGQINIGIGVRTLSNKLFDTIAAFFDGHPGLNVNYVTDMSRDALQMLRENELDIAVERLSPDTPPQELEKFYISKLLDERQCILMAVGDEYSGETLLPFEKLRDKPIISGPVGSIDDRVMKNACEFYGLKLSRVQRSDSIDTVMRLVKSGRGYAIGPRSFADYFGVCAVPLDPDVNISLNLICRRELKNHPIVKRLEHRLREEINGFRGFL